MSKTYVTAFIFVIVSVLIVGSILWYFARQGGLDDNPKGITLQQGGIHPNKVAIRYVNLKNYWYEENISYLLQRAYLVPDIADIGNFRDNYAIGRENIFLVAEVVVTNNNVAQSQRMLVDAGKYLKLVQDESNGAVPPTENNAMYLSSQEEGKQFVIFVVGKDTRKIQLLSGPFDSQLTSNLDFFGGTSTEFRGVFLLKKGLMDAYPAAQ